MKLPRHSQDKTSIDINANHQNYTSTQYLPVLKAIIYMYHIFLISIKIVNHVSVPDFRHTILNQNKSHFTIVGNQ